jgi:glutaredoxin 3
MMAPATPAQRRSRVPEVLIYSTAVCPYCVAAKRYLDNKGVAYSEVLIDSDPARRQEMMQRAQRTSVPQIFVGDTHVGGYDDLVALDRKGGLQPLLDAAP